MNGDSKGGLVVLASIAVPMALVVGGILFLFTITGTTGYCSATSTTGVSLDEDALPEDGIGVWGPKQLGNAVIIMNVAADMGLSTRDQTIGVMTAMGESSLEVIDRGDAAGPDSRGLFQQRDNGAWGTYEDRMDPVRSSEMFFEQLEKVEGREDMEPTLVAHEVQRNEDKYHYASYWEDAKQVVSQLSGVEAEAIPMNTQQCVGVGGGGEPNFSGDCRPVADGIHESACKAYAALTAEFGQFWDENGGVGCQDDREWDNGMGDHPVGQACDYMMAPGGVVPSQEMHQQALVVVQWIMDNHEALDVKYIIYDEAIWNPDQDAYGPWEQVKREKDDYDVDIVGVTGAHIDHIHLSTGPWHGEMGR
ncbi:hypothetical protein O4J56_17785 [Nocardiopsis sp. RSe5-2]|uniref:ARB-07466-like C-terminal domain-containing protein n=1 Tax=Nocardiopsis endophytica TaxID=3018445 RepID=A0ABT4U6C8_9ACTN|nr:hypothetical protein [Nocardiopsis endophytica]MDA2812499.1 hypothetical protein [Nocardiopsis endophytica]